MLLCLCQCSVATAAAVAALAWLLYRLADRHLRAQRADIPQDARAVLVTGCDSGFGRRLAVRLAGRGWCVVAGCLTQEAADQLASEANSQLMVPVVMDVRDAKSVDAAVAKAATVLTSRGLRGLWGVVNNAGISGSRVGPTDLLTQEDFHEVLSVNLYGVVNVSRACLPLMRRLRSSRLVNTSSIFGRFCTPGTSAYAASKYAVQAVSDCQRRELRQFGVHVACIEPGFHRTAMIEKASLARALERAFAEAPAELAAAYGPAFLRQSVDRLDDLLRLASSRLDDVVDAYEEALTSRRPRCRYMVGWDARLLYWPLSVLPECVGDWLIGLRLPRAAAAV